jgi:hypothetical protein
MIRTIPDGTAKTSSASRSADLVVHLAAESQPKRQGADELIRADASFDASTTTEKTPPMKSRARW